MEEPVDAVAAVAPHHREAVGLRVLLNDVTQLSVADARLHCKGRSIRRINWGLWPRVLLKSKKVTDKELCPHLVNLKFTQSSLLTSDRN